MSPVDVLKAAADRGLTLGINGEKLRVLPAERLSSDFANTLRSYKPRLLSLLRLPFVMVYSEALEETVFFCQDEATRGALSIYLLKETGEIPFDATLLFPV